MSQAALILNRIRQKPWLAGLFFVAAAAALAALKLALTTDSSYRASLFYEEGSNFWYFARHHTFFESILHPDNTYFPLPLRLWANLLLHPFNLHNAFPWLFKWGAQIIYFCGILFLFAPRFELLSLRSRAALFFIFCFYPSEQMTVSLNSPYSQFFAVLYLFQSLNREKATWPLVALIASTFFSKALLILLLPVPVVMLAEAMCRSPERRAGWLLASIIFVVMATLMRNMVPPAPVEQPPASLFLMTLAYFSTLGLSLGGFFTSAVITLVGPSAAAVWIFGVATVLIGLVFQGFIFRLVIQGIRRGHDELMMGVLGLCLPLQIFAVLKFRERGGYSPILGSPPDSPHFPAMFDRSLQLLHSRHMLIAVAMELVLLFFLIEKSAWSEKKKRWAVVALVLMQLPAMAMYKYHKTGNPPASPFSQNVYRSLPLASPARHCFPLGGFPRFGVEHFCHLVSKVPQRVRLIAWPAPKRLSVPPRLNAILVRNARGRKDYALKIDGKTARGISDSPDSQYWYYWLGDAGPIVEIDVENLGKAEQELDFYYYASD